MARKKKSLCVAFFIIINFLNLNNAYGGEMVGMFNKEKEIVYPFSGFEGQLLYKGEPAAGAVITRIYNQMEEGEVKEIVTADNQGRFKFESIALEFKEPLISALSYISFQDVFIDYKEKKYHIWTSSKEQKYEYSEFDGGYKEIVCEMTEEPTVRNFKKHNDLLVTSCNWEN